MDIGRCVRVQEECEVEGFGGAKLMYRAKAWSLWNVLLIREGTLVTGREVLRGTDAEIECRQP